MLYQLYVALFYLH